MWLHQHCLLETVLSLSYRTKICWDGAQKNPSWHHEVTAVVDNTDHGGQYTLAKPI